jgi:8-oxo-dGTP diphosphatase
VLGWDKFQSMVESINLPVFALGGMTLSDLPTAINRGAQGIAGIGEWWN